MSKGKKSMPREKTFRGRGGIETFVIETNLFNGKKLFQSNGMRQSQTIQISRAYY